MYKYVIRNTKTGEMLVSLCLGVFSPGTSYSFIWTYLPDEALKLEQEEASATIQFINDVLDWELAQDLVAEEV